MTPRAALLARLGAIRYDILVIGGGIVGAGIARDAAMRGLKVALIEQGDFAGGTSSKTSKLIHGGLRYLEHGHVRLVHESLQERQTLRTIAPGLVRPLSLLLPVYQGDLRAPWKLHLGLWLYDALAGRRNLRPHRVLPPRRAVELEPALRLDGLKAAGLYADCQMDDARLCLANILQAAGFGAVCANYVRLREFLKVNGQVCGGTVEDAFTGRLIDIQARAVVNATGPWADRTRRLSDPSASPRLAPTKGIHVILPQITREALFVEARADRRMFFILPWGGQSLVGTTETNAADSVDALSASADEVGYLLEEVNRLLPGSRVGPEDVLATFAGARPLLAAPGRSATQASREHRIEEDSAGLISVMGGKYTTFRRMAQEAVDAVLRRHRWAADRSLSDQVSLIEAPHPASLEHWEAVTRAVDPDLLGRCAARYGAGMFHLLSLMAQDPQLAQPICQHHEVAEAELAHSLQQELACTLTDVLARRTRIAWSPCQGLDALSRLSELCTQYGRWPQAKFEEQAAEYRKFLASGLAFRGSAAAAPKILQEAARA